MNDLLGEDIYEDLMYKQTTENEAAMSDYEEPGGEDMYSDNELYRITEWKKESHDIQFSINRSNKSKITSQD